MSIRLLLPAYGRHGSSVIAADGHLRVVDRPKRICHGYANGCICTKCKQRVKEVEMHRNPAPPEFKHCECDRPLTGTEGNCAKCGHPPKLKLAA